MTTRDPEIVQTAGNLLDQIRNTCFGQAHPGDVGGGAPSQQAPNWGHPPVPGDWWRSDWRRVLAPRRARLRRAARRATSDESSSWSGVGSDGIASHAWFATDWSSERR